MGEQRDEVLFYCWRCDPPFETNDLATFNRHCNAGHMVKAKAKTEWPLVWTLLGVVALVAWALSGLFD